MFKLQPILTFLGNSRKLNITTVPRFLDFKSSKRDR